MKKFILVLCFTLSINAYASVVDRVVATVNGTVITQSDLDTAIREAQKISSKFSRTEVLNNLINQKLLESELKKQNIVITDEAVMSSINDIARQNGTTVENMRSKLAEQGVAFEDYKESIRENLEKNEFLKKIIYPRIRVSEHDIDQYYQAHSSQFSTYSQIRYLEIALTPDSVPSGNDPMVFAKKLIAQIKGGTPFSKIASQYSRGAFASNGGDSGILNTKDLRPDLLNLLLQLKNGEISDPIPTSTGIFIFKMMEKRNPSARPLGEVKPMIQEAIFQEKAKDELESYIMEVRSNSFIEIKS